MGTLPAPDFDGLPLDKYFSPELVLPYDPTQYRARLSAVFVDDTSMGLPVVVPAGTWMSTQLAEGRGAGVVFAAPQATDIADAVRRAVADPSLALAADTARTRARETHDPGAVLDTIIGWMPVAA